MKESKKPYKKVKRSQNKIFGIATRPRLNIFRSNLNIYAQLIDDLLGRTLVMESTLALHLNNNMTPSQAASLVGQKLAQKARLKGIKSLIIDTEKYPYKGRIKALIDAVAKEGIHF
jgi:large subunit ribosomal protein L18